MKPAKPKAVVSVTSICLSLSTFAADLRADELAPGAPADTMTIDAVATGLDEPTALAFLPDGRFVVTELGGTVRLFAAGGSEIKGPGDGPVGFIPVNDSPEQGLLNVIVHPQFERNRLLIFYYSSPGTNDLDRHRVVAIPLTAAGTLDLASERILLRDLPGPANHNGGGLALSKDGTSLYVGVGDTGCNSGEAPGDGVAPTNYFGTCLTNPNGKVLRIRLDGSIPTDNPLVALTEVTACGAGCGQAVSSSSLGAPRKEIYAWGFRNPFRLWTDPVTGHVWVGDVGEVTYEEVNVITTGGGHFGWPWREGPEGFPVSKCSEITPTGTCIDPAYFCRQDEETCVSITGGLIVDEPSWPEALRGRYYFGDNATGYIGSLAVGKDRKSLIGPAQPFATSTTYGGPVQFVSGPDGALYYVVIDGRIERVAPRRTDGGGGAGGAGWVGGIPDDGAAGDAAGGDVAGGGVATGGVAAGGVGAGGESRASNAGSPGLEPAGPDGGEPAAVPSGGSSGCDCSFQASSGAAAWILGALMVLGLVKRRRVGRRSS